MTGPAHARCWVQHKTGGGRGERRYPHIIGNMDIYEGKWIVWCCTCPPWTPHPQFSEHRLSSTSKPPLQKCVSWVGPLCVGAARPCVSPWSFVPRVSLMLKLGQPLTSALLSAHVARKCSRDHLDPAGGKEDSGLTLLSLVLRADTPQSASEPHAQ